MRPSGEWLKGRCASVRCALRKHVIARHIETRRRQGRGHNAVALAHIVAILGMAGVVGRQCIAVNRANSFRRFMAGVGIIAMVAMMVLRRRCRAIRFRRPGANVRGPDKNCDCQRQRHGNPHTQAKQPGRFSPDRRHDIDNVTLHSDNIVIPVAGRSSESARVLRYCPSRRNGERNQRAWRVAHP